MDHETLSLHKAMSEALGKMRDDQSAMRKQMQDFMQQRSTRPLGGGGEDHSSLADQIVTQFQKEHDLGRLSRGAMKGSVRIELDAAAARGLSVKSTIFGNSGDRPLVPPDRATSITTPAERRLTVEALLPSVPTDSNMTEFPQEATYTNAAAPQGAGSSPAETEGQPKAQSSMTFTLVQSPILTLAHWFAVSRQALDDAPGLRQHIETRGIYGLALEVEDQLLNGDGASGNLDGLIANAIAYNRGSSNDNRADTLRRAVTQLLLADHVPTGVIINPVDDEAIDLGKDTTNQYLQVKVGGRIWQVPLVVTQAIAAGKFLMGDFVMAGRVRDRQSAFVTISTSHEDFFVRNLAAVLIERRLGLEIHRPTALVYGNLIG